MTHLEMKKKVLGLIEELNPDHELLTDDPDIATKFNEVTNQVMYEMCRFKKIARYIEIPVTVGEIIDFERIEEEGGSQVYQIESIEGVSVSSKAKGTIFKVQSSGVAEIDYYIYPERITEKTKDEAYEFELSADVLEIMPYGIAADLLKSDVSAQYGRIYETRYKEMIELLDSRNSSSSITVEGGWDI